MTATSREHPCPTNVCKRVKKKFPGRSAGKESTCTAGDSGLIPGSGRSAGEGIGYPLQYSWTSLMAQQVNNLPAMWETWVRSLGWEDPLEKGMATIPVFWPGYFHGLFHEVSKSGTLLSDFHILSQSQFIHHPRRNWLQLSDHTIMIFWVMKTMFAQFFCVFLPPLLNIFCFCQVHTISVFYCAHLCMKCSLGISNFLEEISSLSLSIISLYFFALVTEEIFEQSQ